MPRDILTTPDTSIEREWKRDPQAGARVYDAHQAYKRNPTYENFLVLHATWQQYNASQANLPALHIIGPITQPNGRQVWHVSTPLSHDLLHDAMRRANISRRNYVRPQVHGTVVVYSGYYEITAGQLEMLHESRRES